MKIKTINKHINKNMIMIILMCFLLIGYYSKSYSIYKLQEKYDVIIQKIDGYTPGDVQIAAIIDGEETDEFPSYETNYKVLSVECTNGSTGTFDVENWEIKVADMSSTSTKCTVSFDSTRKNTVTPVNMSKTEILALNEEIRNTSARAIADYLYPVGSIFTTTELATINQVEEKFGGTWVKYSEGTMLMGVDDTHEVNSTGGSSTTILSVENIPDHSHTTAKSSTSTMSLTAGSAGSHNHITPLGSASFNWPGAGNNTFTSNYSYGKGNFYYNYTNGTSTSTSGAHTHSVTGSVTIPSLSTNSCTNCNSTALNIQNPYVAVYMYKRTA